MTFREILDELRIPYQTEGTQGCRPGWINLICPWCHDRDAGKFYLGYNLSKNFASCWRCGWHSLGEILVESGKITWHEAKRLLGNVEIPEYSRTKIKSSLTLPKGIGPLLHAHKIYLRKRGFRPEKLVKYWDIMGIGHAVKLPWRIYIPFYYRGEVVSWTTRAIGNSTAKYISAGATEESLPHKSLLYNEDQAEHTIIVCEGPLDVWKIGPGAVATCGVGFSANQVLRMSRYPRRIICFDPDEAGQKRAQQLCDQLEGFPGRTENVVLDTGDPGSADAKEISLLRRMLK